MNPFFSHYSACSFLCDEGLFSRLFVEIEMIYSFSLSLSLSLCLSESGFSTFDNLLKLLLVV